ncbi:putative inactive receptor kinase [Dorcoceras hygrometricum]|uniref:Putative inactive receptor kinase n=1 Tax=Dorcoceras hygrometricum TaxID=472368 RepID=A0A2Z7BP59_9LAMI|nr:putative inactive receptor kinase [Dorcoceras hygrometricum]
MFAASSMKQILIWACVISTFLSKSAKSDDQQKTDTGGGAVSTNQILMFSGYFLIGLALLLIVLLWLYKRSKKKEEKIDADNKVVAIDESTIKPSFSTEELKAGGVSKTDISHASTETGMVSSSLIVLTSPEVNGLKFEDLLKALAELLGRGSHGSVYKVMCGPQGTSLAVKRIKNWDISSIEFKQRMRRLNQVKHPHVLPPLAFYSSRQEKLLVYEYQQHGSLFRLIHHDGSQSRQQFDWSSRLNVASTIADALAFMHEELKNDRIPHGNLKSSNILLNKNMEPCISEYGLMLVNQQAGDTLQGHHAEGSSVIFKADTYAFGVILLELLTGRRVLNDGLDLASWVLAVVREEWTVEVFDRNLVREGASEERMVSMLHVAIKCISKSPKARPSMNQVALMISMIKEDEDKSMDVSELSITRSFIDA